MAAAAQRRSAACHPRSARSGCAAHHVGNAQRSPPGRDVHLRRLWTSRATSRPFSRSSIACSSSGSGWPTGCASLPLLRRLPQSGVARHDAHRTQLRGARHSKQRDGLAVRHHYDVSNEFFALWLDRRMVYSCAYFEQASDALDQAQEQKLDYICRKLRLKEGERLLDIGCGWGGADPARSQEIRSAGAGHHAEPAPGRGGRTADPGRGSGRPLPRRGLRLSRPGPGWTIRQAGQRRHVRARRREAAARILPPGVLPAGPGRRIPQSWHRAQPSPLRTAAPRLSPSMFSRTANWCPSVPFCAPPKKPAGRCATWKACANITP